MSNIAVGTDNFEHSSVSTDTEVKIVLRDKKRSAVFCFSKANYPVIASFQYEDKDSSITYETRLTLLEVGPHLEGEIREPGYFLLESSCDGFKTVLNTYEGFIDLDCFINHEWAMPIWAFDEFMDIWHCYHCIDFDSSDHRPVESIADEFQDFQDAIKQDLKQRFRQS
jgi:hypothetical protein